MHQIDWEIFRSLIELQEVPVNVEYIHWTIPIHGIIWIWLELNAEKWVTVGSHFGTCYWIVNKVFKYFLKFWTYNQWNKNLAKYVPKFLRMTLLICPQLMAYRPR